MMRKASDKWYFTKETNAKGLCYIYAYQTRWDPVTKKSKRSARKYVGRLAADSVVKARLQSLADIAMSFVHCASSLFLCESV